MKSAAAYTSGGPRLTDRNQLGDGAEDLIVDHGLIVERPELPIGARLYRRRAALITECAATRNAHGRRSGRAEMLAIAEPTSMAGSAMTALAQSMTPVGWFFSARMLSGWKSPWQIAAFRGCGGR